MTSIVKEITVDLSEFADDEIIEEIKYRDLEHEFFDEEPLLSEADESELINELIKDGNEAEKLELFRYKMHMISREQWNYIFKEVERLSKEDRANLPKDYSNVLNETVS
jgi:hypothetical protein